MKRLRFEWDERKAASNCRKHGVSFEEARTVFFDDNALLRPDEEHSDDKDRFVLLRLSGQLRTLVVCHCYRGRTRSSVSSPRARRIPSSAGSMRIGE